MDKSMNTEKNESSNVLHIILNNELNIKKKTYNSIHLSALPDKGEKLKKQIIDLENRLQTLTIKGGNNNVITSSIVPSINDGKASKENTCTLQLKEAICDEGKPKNELKEKINPSSLPKKFIHEEGKPKSIVKEKINPSSLPKKSIHDEGKPKSTSKEKINPSFLPKKAIHDEEKPKSTLKEKINPSSLPKKAIHDERKPKSTLKEKINPSLSKTAIHDEEKKYKSATKDKISPIAQPKKAVSEDKSVSDNGSKVKNVLSQIENLPFCKVSNDPNKYPSFSDLTFKHKKKSEKTDVMDSPSFKNWRQPGEVRKIVLTEPKSFIEKPAIKSSLHSQFSLNPVFKVSEESVKKIHNSLVSCPDGEESEPENLKSTLMSHQKKGLAWMMWREEQDPKGGILADDMGLGKTVSMISLILKQKERKDFCSPRDHDFECRGTLIVCIPAVIYQWNYEIINHCEADALKLLLYHDSNRDRDVKKMKSYDVVLTTYSTILVEKKEMDSKKVLSPLFCLKWERIILDEAHIIKNHNSQTAQAIFSLKSFRKWAVTGTPIHNVFKDFYALVKFLQFSPFDDKKKFKALTDTDSDKCRLRRSLLVKSILLRRTKDEKDKWGKPLIEMKKKSLSLHYIELSKEERRTYNKLSDEVRNKFSHYLEKTSNLTSLLVLLLKLQQCCNHLSLLKKKLESSNDPSDVADALASLTIDESLSSSCNGNLDVVSPNLVDEKLDISFKSTKITNLFKELHKIFELSDNKDKSVIVSQWTSMLDIIAFHLKQENIAYHLIAGNTKVEDRQKFTNDFNYNESGAKIMLLSLKAGGVGLNLIGANHLFLMDHHWNPALEAQACDRIHRVGQKKDVVIHKFICKNTIEEKINELQRIKRRIASKALSGTKYVTTGLKIDDYKMLFGIL